MPFKRAARLQQRLSVETIRDYSVSMPFKRAARLQLLAELDRIVRAEVSMPFKRAARLQQHPLAKPAFNI